jgi:hypothetical protein
MDCDPFRSALAFSLSRRRKHAKPAGLRLSRKWGMRPRPLFCVPRPSEETGCGAARRSLSRFLLEVYVKGGARGSRAFESIHAVEQ